MLKEYFGHYIKHIRKLIDRTVGYCITGINTINALLEKYSFPIRDLFEVHTIAELCEVKEFICSNMERG